VSIRRPKLSFASLAEILFIAPSPLPNEPFWLLWRFFAIGISVQYSA
jgi:hypothetical protein